MAISITRSENDRIAMHKVCIAYLAYQYIFFLDKNLS